MSKELIVPYMPNYSTELMNEFTSEPYERIILSSDKYYYGHDYQEDKNAFRLMYKIYYIIEKKPLNNFKDTLHEDFNEMYIDISGIDVNSTIYDDFKYMYYVYNINYLGETKTHRNFYSTENKIIFTDLKQNSIDSLFYIMGRNILRKVPNSLDTDDFDVPFKSSYILKAKISLDNSFKFHNYLYKSKSLVRKFYINGIRLVKAKKRPLHDFYVFSESQKERYFPEQYHEIKFSYWLEE